VSMNPAGGARALTLVAAGPAPTSTTADRCRPQLPIVAAPRPDLSRGVRHTTTSRCTVSAETGAGTRNRVRTAAAASSSSAAPRRQSLRRSDHRDGGPRDRRDRPRRHARHRGLGGAAEHRLPAMLGRRARRHWRLPLRPRQGARVPRRGHRVRERRRQPHVQLSSRCRRKGPSRRRSASRST
jgi:hypothetical protein